MITLQITPQTIIADLLNAYPQLEDKLIEIAPVFKKLQNPVLRRTIAKVTTLKQASVVGNVELGYLVNELRRSAGLETILNEVLTSGNTTGVKVNLFDAEKFAVTYDARTDLNNGIHPLARVMKDVSDLKNGEVYQLITPFIPAPLIDKLLQKGYEVNHRQTKDDFIETFVSRK